MPSRPGRMIIRTLSMGRCTKPLVREVVRQGRVSGYWERAGGPRPRSASAWVWSGVGSVIWMTVGGVPSGRSRQRFRQCVPNAFRSVWKLCTSPPPPCAVPRQVRRSADGFLFRHGSKTGTHLRANPRLRPRKRVPARCLSPFLNHARNCRNWAWFNLPRGKVTLSQGV